MHTTAAEPTAEVRVTPTVAFDLASRDCAGRNAYDGTPNPYAAIEAHAPRGGVVRLTKAEAAELEAECRYQADYGPGEYLTAGERRSYRQVADRARAAAKALA